MTYTHHNNALTINNINETVYLKGWVGKVRNLGGLLFVDLRDRFGVTQLVIKPEDACYQEALKLRNEYVIEAKGKVIERESKNKLLVTGEIEVEVKDLLILSKAETPPIMISNDSDALEDTRLRYRYLDLRRPVMQNYMIKRHEITQAIRRSLLRASFYELETPILGKSTPEGARDYLVPSRLYPKQFYALPQSPQIYKQLFMVAGFEKYFQVAKCFRDEDLRADRQPEFTQIDIEASFVKADDIMSLTETVLKDTFKDVLNIELQTPFLRMSYQEAMDNYGTDKPDMRYDYLLKDYTEIFKDKVIPLFEGATVIKGIVVDHLDLFTRKQLDQLTELVKKHHGQALAYVKVQAGQITGSLAKYVDLDTLKALSLNDGEMVLIVPGTYEDVSQSLGALRVKIAEMCNAIPQNTYRFLWVTDWPLLEYSETDQRFYAKHHPFTQPRDVETLKHDPKGALANAYDIVLNGYEMGGGSMRIYDQDVQQLMFETLGLTKTDIQTRFGFFVDALKYGTPPHGGIALGLDRMVMLMTGTQNIKDVIAFPKTQSARDLMMDAPTEVDALQLHDLNIKVEK